MKILYIFIFSILYCRDTYSQVLKFPIDSSYFFAKQIVATLPEEKFYFLGQLHNNEANTILEKEFLFSLNKQFGVSYDIIEYSHSLAVIFNEYLLTGQDSLLSFITPKANFKFIKSVKQFNDSVDENRKIKFYGVDFEGRNSGKFTKKAISLILKYSLDKDNPLYYLLKTCEQSDSIMLHSNLNEVKKYLEKNITLSKKILGDKYLDILLITNVQYGMSLSKVRDKSMYANIKYLYNELSTKYSSKPKFFASFGIAHINPRNSKGIANILNSDEESPFKNGIVTLGVQYLNCYFGTSNEFKSSTGILDWLCNKKLAARMIGSTNNKSTFSFFTDKDLNYIKCKTAIKNLTGIIVIENFKGTANWIWE
ncbi:MAG: hypothetical protein JWO92_2182 [Chitinophagaceae bacterium]|nr:hypothetical protein [Chitinophagaceae bacterium]